VTRTVLLARTFFQRFFESELLPPGLPQVQLVIWSLSLLAAPTLLMPIRMAGRYSLLQSDPPRLTQALFADRLVFLTLGMTAMGLVALVTWQNVFPDRRDARLLGVLPLSGRLLVTARLLALGALASVFLLGINAVPTAMYGLIVGFYGGTATLLLGPVAHLLATGAAGACVFFSLVAVQAICLNVGGRFAERVGPVLQVLFLGALLQQLFFISRFSGLIGADLSRLAAEPLARYVPVFWFLGLYDVLGARPGPGSMALALRAVAATTTVMTISVGMLVLTHARLMRLALEGREATRRRSAMRTALASVVTRLCRTPTTRAVFDFTIQTLLRSRSHRMLLAIYLGLAVAMVAATLGPVAARRGLSGFLEPSVPVLAAPLVLMFFLLTGAHVMMAIPVEPKANWIVRLLEPADRVAAINGIRLALIVMIVTPVAFLAAVIAGVLWGVRDGLAHGLVCTAMGWLLCELLLMRVRKVPFTCTYFPGSRVHFWPFYLVACSTYCFTTAAIELTILNSRRGLAVFLAILLAAIGALAAWRARALTAPPGLRFEEEDTSATFEGFRLSEGLAARTRPAPHATAAAGIQRHPPG
jgi:hypothetical protein